MFPHDYHVHTNFSCDCKSTMTVMCRSAIERGIEEIGFSDHYDLLPEDPCYGFFQADLFWEELQRCRDTFKGLLTIRAGIELGEPHLFSKAIQAMLEKYPWDFSLGSLHWVGSEIVFGTSYFKQPASQAFRRYFKEVARMVSTAEFDILTHMDIVKRYGFDTYGDYDPHLYEEEIRTILQTCARRDIALEVNTSPLRRPVNQTAPSAVILDWFREEGGRWVTLGSDAHTPEEVGYGFDQVMTALDYAGFTHLARYESRHPSPIPLSSQE
jgi:histidinol-phosphatase (PHP family)